MAGGEKWFLERFADAIDEEMRLNSAFFHHDKTTREAGLGKGLLYVFHYSSVIAYGGVISPILDLSRFGESYKKGFTRDAIVSDALRLMVLGGPLLKMGAKFVGIKAIFKVPGVTNSCLPTTSTMAMRITGTNWRIRINDIFASEVGSIFDEGLLLSGKFAGDTFKHWIPTLRKLGLRINELPAIKTFEEVISKVKSTGKSMLIGAEYTVVKDGVTKRAGHAMLVYKGMTGTVHVADNGGAEHIAKTYLLDYEKLLEVYLLEDGRILTAAAGAYTAVRIAAHNAVRFPFWAHLIGLPVHVTDGEGLMQMRHDIGRKLAESSPPAVAVPAAPPILPKGEPQPKIKSFAELIKRDKSVPMNSDNPLVKSTVNEYKVKTGDTLFKLAQKFYWNADKYRFIQAANFDLMRFRGEQQLPVGMVIVIPGN